MAEILIVRNDNEWPFDEEADPIPTTLEGREIHPIFAQDSFRFAACTQHLAPWSLDKEEFDFPASVYERMKPALRLATLFLRTAMPELATIRYAPMKEEIVEISKGEFESRGEYLDVWSYKLNDIDTFEQKVFPQICTDHRFTILGQSAKVGCTKSGGFNTNLMMTHMLPEEDCEPILHTQTFIDSKWLWFLSRPDWNTMADAEKYGQLFLLATSLVREVAHLCWIDRVQHLVNTSTSDEDGPVGPIYEPRFSIHDRYYDLASGLELELFGGIPGLENHGSLSSIPKPPRSGEVYRVSFSIIDSHGRVVAIHDVSMKTIFRFFTNAHPLWNQLAVRQVEYDFLILRNDENLRRRLSTDLSSPSYQSTVPTVRILDPRSLQPAITAANPLVTRDKQGNVPPQRQSRLREIKMRMRELIVSSGNWWERTGRRPVGS